MQMSSQHLGSIFGRHRVHRQCRRAFEPGDDAQARVKLPMPVKRLIEPLAGGRGMQEEVIRRVAESVE